VEHKSKIYKENIILFTIFTALLIYAIIYISSLFEDTKIELPKVDVNISMLNIDTDILIKKYIKEDIQKNTDTNVTIKDEDKTKYNDTSIKNNSVINHENNIKLENKVINNELNTSEIKQDINKTNIQNSTIKTIITPIKKQENNTQQNTRQSIEKNTTITKPLKTTQISKSNITSTDKNMMIDSLRAYIKSTIITVRTNAKNMPSNIDDSIKIRITVLKNGNYQNIKYLSGNKTLLENAKKAVKESFPTKLDNIIQSQFPRYLRFKIEFQQKK
jgi:hypothetical protein